MNFGIFTEAEAKNWKPHVIVLGKENKIENKSYKVAEKLPE
jgi:aspartate 1-decarboxylase